MRISEIQAMQRLDKFWPETKKFGYQASATPKDDEINISVYSYHWPLCLELVMPYPDESIPFLSLELSKDSPSSPIRMIYKILEIDPSSFPSVCHNCGFTRVAVQAYFSVPSPMCIYPYGLRCQDCLHQIIGNSTRFPIPKEACFSEPIFLTGERNSSLVAQGKKALSSIVAAANIYCALSWSIKNLA